MCHSSYNGCYQKTIELLLFFCLCVIYIVSFVVFLFAAFSVSDAADVSE